LKDQEKLPASSSVDQLVESTLNYGEAYAKLLKLEVRNGVSSAITILVLVSFALVLGSFILLFFSAGIAFLLADAAGTSLFASFTIVAAFYLVVLVIIFLLRTTIKRKLDDLIEGQIK